MLTSNLKTRNYVLRSQMCGAVHWIGNLFHSYWCLNKVIPWDCYNLILWVSLGFLDMMTESHKTALKHLEKSLSSLRERLHALETGPHGSADAQVSTLVLACCAVHGGL